MYGCPFFASQVELGKDGVKKCLPIPKTITNEEETKIKEAIPIIQKQIANGIKYVDQNF